VVDASGGLFSSGASFFDIGTAPDDALRNTPEGIALTDAGMFGKIGAASRFMVRACHNVCVYLVVDLNLRMCRLLSSQRG
jgi:hypothetical protein